MKKSKKHNETALIQHCKREFKLAGFTSKSSTTLDRTIYNSTLELIRTLSNQKHTKLSKFITIHYFKKLANFENLSPLTNNPEEWNDISHIVGRPMWQNNRNPRIFSVDGGKTYFDKNNKAEKKGFIFSFLSFLKNIYYENFRLFNK